MDLIEFKIYKPSAPKSKKKPLQNVCKIFFENKGVEFINIAHILRKNQVLHIRRS